MAVLLAYLFYFVAASVNPLYRRWLSINRQIGPGGQIAFAFKVNIIASSLLLLLPFFQPFKIVGNPTHIMLLAAACGLFGALFFAFSFVSQKHVEAGITSLASNVYTPISVALAWLLLGEGLAGNQILGTILLLVALVIISKKHRVGKFRFDKYFLMMILSGVFLGLTVTVERVLQKTTGLTTTMVLSWWAQCLFLGLLTLIVKDKNIHTNKSVTIAGVLTFFHGLSWSLLVFTVGNLGVVSAVTTFKVVLIFVAAAIFLKEREDLPRKIVGSLIAVAGLLLMK